MSLANVVSRSADADVECSRCKYVFLSKEELVQHIEIRGEKKCKYCPEQFADGCHKIKHGAKHRTCEICGKLFKMRAHLESHLRYQHSDDMKFQCTFCDKRFQDNGRLNIHLVTHTGNKRYICSLCPHKSATKNNLIVHMRAHTDVRPYQCPDCPKKFKRSDHLKKHSRTHANGKVFKCADCAQTFAWKQNLARHRKNIHGKMQQLCGICKKAFDSLEQLECHQRSEHGREEREWQCSVCHLTGIKTNGCGGCGLLNVTLFV